jgi:hypothetical protein
VPPGLAVPVPAVPVALAVGFPVVLVVTLTLPVVVPVRALLLGLTRRRISWTGRGSGGARGCRLRRVGRGPRRARVPVIVPRGAALRLLRVRVLGSASRGTHRQRWLGRPDRGGRRDRRELTGPDLRRGGRPRRGLGGRGRFRLRLGRSGLGQRRASPRVRPRREDGVPTGGGHVRPGPRSSRIAEDAPGTARN